MDLQNQQGQIKVAQEEAYYAEKCRADIPRSSGQYATDGASQNIAGCGMLGAQTGNPNDSSVIIRLRERRERLQSEIQKIRRQIERLSETPSTVSMNEMLQIVESTSSPITIY